MKPLIIKAVLFLSVSGIFFKTDAKPTGYKILEIEKCARLEGGLLFAYKAVNTSTIFNPGGSIQYSYCLKSGEHIGFGVGAGIHLFKDEGFIPFYLDVIGMMNKNKNSPFMSLQTGYSFGWNNKYDDFQNPEFSGGFILGIGLGEKIHFNDRFGTYISLTYKYQLASISYEQETSEDYFEKLHYNLFVLSIGIMLEQK